MKSSVIKKILKEMDMSKKYFGIRAYVYGTINVTNSSHPSITKANYIGSHEALNTLRVLNEVMEESIKAFKLSDISIEDVFGDRKSEISQFIHEIFLHGNYGRYLDIEKKYTSYLKVISLEDVYPLKERKLDLESKENEIKRLEAIISRLEATEEAFDTNLGIIFTKKRQLEQLKKEYDELEPVVYFQTPEDFAIELYNTVHWHMTEIKKVIIEKINYLERVLEV